MIKIDETFKPDFSPEECERRMTELVHRCCGRPATFDMNTGQNFSEPKL